MAPAMNPRTVCFCQPIFFMISISVAPPSRCNIVTTWAVFFLGLAAGVPRVAPAPGPPAATGAATAPVVPSIEAVFHGIGQVNFQGNLWTGVLFLVGIALSDWRHASWVLLASVILS